MNSPISRSCPVCDGTDAQPYLQKGDNSIAAVVWNYGDEKPEAQISYQAGFILKGDGENEKIVNTL